MTHNAILDKHNHLVGWRDELAEDETPEDRIAVHEAFDDLDPESDFFATTTSRSLDGRKRRRALSDGVVTPRSKELQEIAKTRGLSRAELREAETIRDFLQAEASQLNAEIAVIESELANLRRQIADVDAEIEKETGSGDG